MFYIVFVPVDCCSFAGTDCRCLSGIVSKSKIKLGWNVGTQPGAKLTNKVNLEPGNCNSNLGENVLQHRPCCLKEKSKTFENNNTQVDSSSLFKFGVKLCLTLLKIILN